MVNLNLINGNVLDKIIPAFFAAKRAFEPVIKNQTNLSCKSSYAVLGAIEDAITPGLTKNGLFFQQPIQIEENDGQVVIKIETILWHCSGQVLSSLFTIPYEGKKTPHTLGSFITYFRCYLLLGFLGIATHDNLDDDANRSQGVLPSTSDQTPSTDPSTENKEVSSELPSADLSKTDPSTENKENVKIFCSLFDQLPKDKREQLIAWGLEKQYYSKTEENFLFDSIPPASFDLNPRQCLCHRQAVMSVLVIL